MRRNKNQTEFRPPEPWLYPAPREFGTEATFSKVRNLMGSKLYNPQKNKHVDRLDEKNMNQIVHLL